MNLTQKLDMENQEFNKFIEDLEAEERRCWEDEYVKLSTREKIDTWASSLFRSMRTQEESGSNPYIIYSQRWLKETLEREPEFMQLLPEIYRVWGGMFDSNKVDNKIKKLFSTLNK